MTKDSIISYDKTSIQVDGHRCFWVMGEIHYSRVCREKWRDELRKIKAGGVDVISAYTIWIHHEEEEGEFDFTGDRDLRTFMEEVKASGLRMFLRIGPWVHAEVRNGGFPDWLIEKSKTEGFRLRSNDAPYLAYVRRFFTEIFHQVEGCFLKDDGPIIGIQIENEYGHVGGFTGEEGVSHMKTLQTMAKEIGYDVPLWTATGWGGAVTAGLLPVMGGYCDAPWEPGTAPLPPSVNYVFTKERNDHNIASDYGIGEGITFDMQTVPYLTCELGGGLQPTAHRRPVATGKDTESMTISKIGSGVSLIGYYMYHGGTNPKGKKTTLQESKATGYPNDLPVKSYDFNAPIREAGQLTDSYRRIRRLSMFLKEFGEDLAEMEYIPQPGNPEDPSDLTSLRTAVRCHDKSGYLFVNNYQRLYPMADHRKVHLTGRDETGEVLCDFGECDIKNGDTFFYPFRMKLSDTLCLQTACATPLTILYGADGRKTFVFYTETGMESFVFDGAWTEDVEVMVLTPEEAFHAMKIEMDGEEYLIVSEGDVIEGDGGRQELIWTVDGEKPESRRPEFRIYPQPLAEDFAKDFTLVSPGSCTQAAGEVAMIDAASMAHYQYQEEFTGVSQAECRHCPQRDGKEVYEVSVRQKKDAIRPLKEAYLMIDYDGERAELYQDEELIRDDFYTGQTWEIDLFRYNKTAFEARMEIEPMTEDMPGQTVYLEHIPEFEGGKAAKIRKVRVVEEYRLSL